MHSLADNKDFFTIVRDDTLMVKDPSSTEASTGDTCNEEGDKSWEPLTLGPSSSSSSSSSQAAIRSSTITTSCTGEVTEAIAKSSLSMDYVSNPNRRFIKKKSYGGGNEGNLIVATTRQLFQKTSTSISDNNSKDGKFFPITITLKFAYYFLPQMCLQNSHYIIGFILVTTGTILHALSILIYFIIRPMILNLSIWLFVYLPLISMSILYKWHTALLKRLMVQLNKYKNTATTTAIDAMVKSCHILAIAVWVLPVLLEIYTYFCVSTALSQSDNLWCQVLSCGVVVSYCYYYFCYDKEAVTLETVATTVSTLITFNNTLRFLLHICALLSLIFVSNTQATSATGRIAPLLPFILIFIGSSLQQQQGATTTWMLECTRHAVRLTVRDIVQELLITLANTPNKEAPVDELLQLVMMRWIVEYWATISSSVAGSRGSCSTSSTTTAASTMNSNTTPVISHKDADHTSTAALGWEEMRSMLSTTANIMMEEISETEIFSSSSDPNHAGNRMQDQNCYSSATLQASSNCVSCEHGDLFPDYPNEDWIASRPPSTFTAPQTVARVFYDDLNSPTYTTSNTKHGNTTIPSVPFSDLQSLLFSFDVDQRARPAVLAYKRFVFALPPSRNVALFMAMITKLPCTIAMLLLCSLSKTNACVILLWGTLPLLPISIVEIIMVHLWIKTITASPDQTSMVESRDRRNNADVYVLFPYSLDSIDILFASIDSEGGKVVLKKHSLFHVYRNMQRSVEALEVGVLVARAAQTTALTLGFATSIIHLTEFRHELNQGWFHGFRLLLAELLEYQELQKRNDDDIYTTAHSRSGGKYATAAHIMMRNSQLVAKNISIIQQDHPLISELIACATGVASHALLAVTGRGWLWGKEEDLSNHDSSHSLKDEKTITESISMDERAQAEAFCPIESNEHNDRMMLVSSTYPNIKKVANIEAERVKIRADSPKDSSFSLDNEEGMFCTEIANEGASDSNHPKGKIGQTAGESSVADRFPYDEMKANQIKGGIVLSRQEESKISNRLKDNNKVPPEGNSSRTGEAEILDAQYLDDFLYNCESSINSQADGSVTVGGTIFVSDQQSRLTGEKVNTTGVVGDCSLDKEEIVGATGGEDDCLIKSPSFMGNATDDDVPEEEASDWTHISSASLDQTNAVDDDNWQQLSPSHVSGHEWITSRQVAGNIETDSQSSTESARRNPLSLVRMVLSPERLARRRSHTRTDSMSTTTRSNNPEWGQWVGGGLAIVGAAAVGAVSLSAVIKESNNKEEASLRIEEIPDDDVAEEIDEVKYEEKMLF